MAARSSRPPSAIPSLRFDISEASSILRMSRAQLYNRIHDGAIRPQKDGSRTYVTRTELDRYVAECDKANWPAPSRASVSSTS